MSISPVSANQQSLLPRTSTASSSAVNSSTTSNDQQAISNAQKTIANEVKTANMNGTITVTTDYTDGTTAAVTNANAPRPVISQSPLAATSGQFAALLHAQQQTNNPTFAI